MGCCTCLSRFVLIVVNTIIGILWLAIAVIGALLAWGTPLVRDIINKYLAPYITALSNQTGGKQIDVSKLVDLVLQLGSTIGIVLFIAGLILMIICFCGLFGACCDNQCMLYTFGITLSILIAAQIVFIIIYFAKPDLFFDPARAELTKTTIEYQGMQGLNAESTLWNLIQPWQQCCGSTGADDFNNPPSKWNHSEKVENFDFTIKYPYTCCKLDETYKPVDNTCPRIFTEANSNINTPCFNQLKAQLTQYSNVAMYIFSGVVVGQGILVVIAFFIACNKDSKIV